MRLCDEDWEITLDDEFPCSSAGKLSVRAPGVYQVGYKPEEIPKWFSDLLDELFDGAGVPKEYMVYVRLRNTGTRERRVQVRFLLSPKGCNYMYPPWWVRRQDGGWAWIRSVDTDFCSGKWAELRVLLQGGETVYLASAPYEEPAAVVEKAKQLAQRSPVWTYGEIGTTAAGRPLPVLTSPARPLKLLVDASMQSSEPVSWGIMHVAHWLTLPTAHSRRLLDHIQFLLLPITNPDGVYAGYSVTNGVGEVPKFGINNLVEGKGAPHETKALWGYLLAQRPDASIEVHAHFTRADFTRSIGMHDKASMPAPLAAKAAILEEALFANYHADPLDNRKVLIDPRQPEHNVYGDRYVSERAGTIRTFLQGVPDSIEALSADVVQMVETVAEALIQWQESSD